MSTSTIDSVYSELRQVFDPEIPVNIVDLGLVYDVQLEGETCKVRMTLTSRECPEAKTIPDMVKRRANTVEGVNDTDVEVRLLIERAGWNAQMARGSLLMTLPEYYDLFGTEAPAGLFNCVTQRLASEVIRRERKEAAA